MRGGGAGRARGPGRRIAMNRSTLFRAAALDAKRPRALGRVVLVQPVSIALLTGAAVVAAAVAVAFLVLGTYSERTTVKGRLVPDRGLLEVRSPQYGTIVEKHVVEGQAVERGQRLYVVSSERISSALGPTQERIAREVGKRVRSLEDEIERVRKLERSERAADRRMLAELEAEAAHVGAMHETQAARVELAEQDEARFGRLQARGFVSAAQVVAKREDLLEQRTRLQGLDRDRSGLARQLTGLKRELADLSLKYGSRRAELERNLASARQELTESEARRRFVLTAPLDGVATAVVAHLGQLVEGNSLLVSIAPEGARLQADLYAPSRAVGLVNVGDPVLLRYAAYPYQKFGHQEGSVAAVSRSSLPLADLMQPGGTGAGQAEPVYRITVTLGSQSIEAYGRPRPLRAGMLVEADVLGESRRLYEWVLDPLYTLAGR